MSESGFRLPARRLPALLLTLLVLGNAASCSHQRDTTEEARVQAAFTSCQSALVNHQNGPVMACMPQNVRDYLARLKTENGPSAVPSPKPVVSEYPGVDLLLRTALQKKVPPDLLPTLTLDVLMQRIADKRLLNPRDIAQLKLGHVSINGNRASGEIYYDGTLSALRLPFLKEGADWKIDLLAALPFAELLMRLDRAIKGQTEEQQVEQLVSRLPSL